MIEAAVSQTTITYFSRPFAETHSSSAQTAKAIPDEVRIPGANLTPLEIEKYVGDEPSQSWFWSEDWQAGEREAQDDIANRHGDFFEGSDAFLDSL